MSESIFRGVGNKTVPLHHAYAIEGERNAAEAQVMDFLEEMVKFSTSGNPDFHSVKVDVFSIEDARRVVEAQALRSLSADSRRKVFIIAFSSSTVEAQNALLKAVEEPAEGTHFFFIVPSMNVIIPTLLSRLQTVYLEKNIDRKSMAGDFLKMAKPKRLEMVKKLLAEAEKNEKEKEFMANFLDDLEREIWLKAERGNLKDWRKALESVGQCKKHSSVRSPKPLLILEHLSLVLPMVSR